jgi:hypothetical protein
MLETSVSSEGENRTPMTGILIQTRTNTGRFAKAKFEPGLRPRRVPQRCKRSCFALEHRWE